MHYYYFHSFLYSTHDIIKLIIGTIFWWHCIRSRQRQLCTIVLEFSKVERCIQIRTSDDAIIWVGYAISCAF
jgi:hypothetical protein